MHYEEDGVGSPAAPEAAVVQNSLHGLVSELDKLRETLGYSNGMDQLERIEQHVAALQTENEELRSYAEEAIKEAERLAQLNDELAGRLHQQELDEQMGAVLAETQKLKDVADEFEKDLVMQKLAEAEERAAEIAVLKGRVRELEEENAAVTQTLNEFRASSEQLQRLRVMEEEGPGPLANGGVEMPPRNARGRAAAAGSGRRGSSPSPSPSMGSAGGYPPVSGGRHSRTPSLPLGAGPVVPPHASTPAAAALAAGMREASVKDAARLAEQLEVVAAGNDTGVVASAAKCLRDYAAMEATLTMERQEADRLRHEVDELRDTMFSKSFKPPSAWAEREVKYKMEKRQWEESTKELSGRVTELERENSEYRAAGKAHMWEERIQELEAQLLQTERQKDDARAQLHELQISMRDERYNPARANPAVGHQQQDVHEVVAHLEQQRIGMSPPVLPSLDVSRSSFDGDGAGSERAFTPSFGRGVSQKSERLQALSRDRASADAAWEEHNRRSDVAGLRRSKAELETKVAMLEQQIGKMQWAIEHADQTQAAMEEELDTAIQTGDVKNLSTLREKLKAGLATPRRLLKKGGNGGPAPSKQAMSKQLHEKSDALRSSEAEKNALRRQLAKLSKKYKAMATGGTAAGHHGGATENGGSAAEAAVAAAAGGAARRAASADGRRASLDAASASGAAAAEGAAPSPGGSAHAEAAGGAAAGTVRDDETDFGSEELDEFLVPGIDDEEMEVLTLREENELLMDQLVTTKVRLAETEGDFLESKRELLRAKEKHQHLVETMDKLKRSHQDMQGQLAQQQQVQAQMAAAMQAQGMAPPMPPPGAAPPAPGAPGMMAPPPGIMAPGLMAPPGGPMQQQQQYHAQYQPAMSPLGQGAIQLAAATVPPAGPGPSPGRGDDAAAAAAAAGATPPQQPDSIKDSLAKRTNSWMMSLKLSG